MSKQEKGDKKRFEVGVFVQVKGGTKPFGRISGENGKQRWLVRLVGADGKLEANDVEKTSRMINIQQEPELPANVKVLFGLVVADDGSIEIEAVSDDNESFAVNCGEDDDDDDVLLDQFDVFDEDDDLLPTTTPARRRSLHGRRVQHPTVPPPRNIRFEAADDLIYRQDDNGSFDEEERDMEEEQIDPEVLAHTDLVLLDEIEAGGDEHRAKLLQAEAQKAELIGRTIELKNLIKWTIVEDIDDFAHVTAKRRPDREVGIIGLDFNELTNAEFPLVEPYLRCHPGDAFEQLTRLNKAGMERYQTRWVPATVKEFFLLLACLLAAIPSEQGGEQLWETACMKGVCARPELGKIMKLKRFKQLKGLYPAAFAASEETTEHSGNWSPIEGVSATNDPWKQIQLLVNDFNATIKKNYVSSDRLCLDESMSAWRPRQDKYGGLPHISFIKRKPKPLGTEFKSVADAESGIMLHLEIQRGKGEMNDAAYKTELGATAACTKRLAEATSNGECDTFYGDSWFASAKTANEIKKLGHHFVGIVKTAHRNFPKVFLEQTMSDWPGGTYLVMKSKFGKIGVISNCRFAFPLRFSELILITCCTR